MSHPEFPVESDPDAFEFGVPRGNAEPPQSVGHFSATVTPGRSTPGERIKDHIAGMDPPLPPVAPARDPLEEGNKARERAGQRLSELVWQFPDGSRKVPLLSSSRWCLYEALRGKVGADEGAVVLTTQQATSEAYRRRYIEAGILLYLCLHSCDTWEQSRSLKFEGRTVEIEPLAANFSDFLAAIREWVDKSIPTQRLPQAVALANSLTEYTFSAATIRPPSADDEDDERTDSEKKTPFQDGTIGTFPSSAQPSG